MNCAECRDNLVACAEGLLDRAESLRCREHLESCATCRNEFNVTANLQQRLVARGRSAAGVSIVAPVMQRVRAVQPETERETIMSILCRRWGFGLGAIAAVAAIVACILVVSSPEAQATAEQIMARGAKAVGKLTSVHFRGKVRTLPNDNFSYVSAESDFHPVELWKEWQPELKWRVEKPGRVAVMDGRSTLLYIKPANTGMKLPQASQSAFDTEWLHKIANLGATITNELYNAVARGWKLRLREERAADGRAKAIVTVDATAGLPENDYLKNKFFDASDTRRVYRFDSESELLEGVQVYLVGKTGERLMFELEQIEYNQPIAATVFELDLPADVNWYQSEIQILPDNEKYASMTAEQAARAYFEALMKKDWTEAEKFRRDRVGDRVKLMVASLELVNVGQSFTSAAYDPNGRFVPYEIKVGGQTLKHNLALKRDQKSGRWIVDGGGF